MRRASIRLALLGFAALCLPASALATPTVTLKARAVPIPKNLAKKTGPTWPHTGNILGAPAAVNAVFKISGKEYPTAAEFPGLPEYEYAPPPLRRVTFYLPKGTKINTKGFPTCAVSYFERQDPEGCKKTSFASPPGEADGVVSFGTTHVHEKVKVQAYFAPGKSLTFYIEGRSPAAIEQYASGRLKTVKAGKFNQELLTEVPLIETLPDAPLASAEYINVKVGAAIKKGKKLLSYGTMPGTCPKGGFPVKAELFFGPGSESTWSKATVETTAPCPKGAAKATSKGKGHKAHKSTHKAHKKSHTHKKSHVHKKKSHKVSGSY